MSAIIRSAKSGGDWTLNDLESYNISLNQVNHLEFFGVQVRIGSRVFENLMTDSDGFDKALPQPVVDQELLNVADADDMQQDRLAEFINLLDLAMIPEVGETAVDDFAVELFKVMGYVRRHRVARTRADLPLFICGELRHAKTDVCIVDRAQNDILLLVQEDKRLEHGEPISARAQLVAEGVAAFNENNAHREAVELPVLEEKVNISLEFFDYFLKLISPRSCLVSSWLARRPPSLKSPLPKLWRLIFAMGPTLQRKPASPFVIHLSRVLPVAVVKG
jgi:hypothetical protein